MIEDGLRRVEARSVADFQLLDVSYPSGLSLPEHDHDRDYICLVVDGGCDFRYRGRPRRLQPGVLFWQGSHQPHAGRFGDHGATIFHLRIPPDLVEVGQGPEPEADVTAAATACAWQLRKAGRGPADELELECLSLELLGHFVEDLQQPAGAPWLAAAVEMLRHEYSRPLSVAAVAAQAGRHPCHVARAFRQGTGMTVGRFLQRVRVGRAAACLQRQGASISQIAHECGFSDQSHMGRLFKRHLGMTPQQYRNLV